MVSEARTLDRFIAPAQERLWSLARNLWWSWDHECVSLFRDLESHALAPAQSESHLAARARFRWTRSSAAPRNWCCTAASTMSTAASRSI